MDNKKCVGCGFCCLKAICSAGARIYGPNVSPCPSLEWRETRYYCKLMELPGEQGLYYKNELYAGDGCCSNLNTWRNDIKNRSVDLNKDKNICFIDPLFQIFLKCLGNEFISTDTYYLVLGSVKKELIKRKWTEENATLICNHIIQIINSNRRKYMKNFMG